MSIAYTDIFCGAGGSSIGLTAAGFELKLAANHWARAIETHSANFRDAEHLCADVSNYDMRRLPRTDILWASPICTEISPAGGRRRTNSRGQSELELFGPIAKDGYDRTRATFHDVIRATEVHRYRAVLVENVVDVADTWELFDWWVEGMLRLGYQVQYVSVSSAHIGDDQNTRAPQWRDRLYLVFTAAGIPLPDVDPRPLAYCQSCDQDVAATQSWKDPRRRRIGKYRQRYVYRCPNTACRHSIIEPYVRPAAAAIDWTDLGTRIGDRTRPLAAKTLARIKVGLEMFAQPITLEAAGNTFERRPGVRTHPAYAAPLTTLTTDATKGLACPPVMVSVNHDGPDGRPYPVGSRPLSSRTARIGDGLASLPMLVPSGGTWREDAIPVDVPMGARTTRDTDALVCPPFIAELRGGGSVARPVTEPLATVTASGLHHGLTTPPGAITARDLHALVIPYYRTGRAKTTAAPLDTVTTRDRFALVSPDLEVEDCLFRMLNPREHLRAQCFPDTYRVFGNKGEQTMQAGNAVSSNVARWLGERLAAVLDGAA